MLAGSAARYSAAAAPSRIRHDDDRDAEHGRAQATDDRSIFVVGLLSSLSAGALLDAAGWQMTSLLPVPWLAAAAQVILGLARTRRQSATA